MEMITKKVWENAMQSRKGTELAEFVLDSLHGYRKTSLQRSDDVDSLYALFEAIREDQKYRDY
jgi:hypothetical protein